MLSRAQVLRIVPFVLLVVTGFITGIVGWGINYGPTQGHYTWCWIMGVEVIGGVVLHLVWRCSPPAARNEASGTRSAMMMTVTWLVEGLAFSMLLSAVLFSGMPIYVIAPYTFLLALLELTFFVQMVLLSMCSMPSLLHRIFIAWPAAIMFSAGGLTMLSGIGLPVIMWVPYGALFFLLPLLLACVGLYQTVYTPSSLNEWDRGIMTSLEPPLHPGEFTSDEATVKRCRSELSTVKIKSLGASNKGQNQLRIVQITDPHLGTMMSVERLRRICEQTVAAKPDLVLLTGDFYTVEAYERSQHALAKSLEPLAQLGPNKLFACTGNHDKEHCARGRMEEDLKTAGVTFLRGEQAFVDTAVGKVQIIGLDYQRPSPRRTEHIVSTCERTCQPTEDTVLRIVMLHDPGAFHLLPNQANLVFSGHTHGGQVGLLSLGIDMTLIRIAGIPDQGFFRHGSNRLYVHRAHGCRSMLGTFLVRLGCPPEYSVLDVDFSKTEN